VFLAFWGNPEDYVSRPGTGLYIGEAMVVTPTPPTSPVTQDNKLRRSALAVLQKWGIEATLTHYTAGGYNTNTGIGTQMSESATVKVSPPSPYDQDYAQTDLTRNGTASTLMADRGLSTKPAPGDKLAFGSETWEVVGVEEIKYRDSTIAWELSLSR
jgi:hypothetical protein